MRRRKYDRMKTGRTTDVTREISLLYPKELGTTIDRSGGPFRGASTRNTSLVTSSEQQITDDPLLTASASSTTSTGEIPFAEDPCDFSNRRLGLGTSKVTTEMNPSTKGAWVPLVRKLSPLPPSDLYPTLPDGEQRDGKALMRCLL